MLKVVSISLVIAWIALGARRADAQVGIPYKIYDAEHWPESFTKRTLTLPEGQFEIGGDATVFLSAQDIDVLGTQFHVSNIVAVSPRVQYGVNSLVTLGFAQASTFSIVPDNSDPAVTGAEKLDYRVGAFLLEGLFRFLGGYDIAAHVQVPIHYFEGDSSDPMNVQSSKTFVDLRVALEGRLVFADRMGNLRFRTGFAAQDLGGHTSGVVDLDMALLYQTTKSFMIGAHVGLTPNEWLLSDSNKVVAPLELLLLYTVIPELDLTLRAGIQVATDHNPGLPDTLPVVSLGARYRP